LSGSLFKFPRLCRGIINGTNLVGRERCLGRTVDTAEAETLLADDHSGGAILGAVGAAGGNPLPGFLEGVFGPTP